MTRRVLVAGGAGLLVGTAAVLAYAAAEAFAHLDDRGAVVLALGAVWFTQGLRAWIRAIRRTPARRPRRVLAAGMRRGAVYASTTKISTERNRPA